MLRLLAILLTLAACTLPAAAETSLQESADQVRKAYGQLAPTADVIVAPPCGELNAAYEPLLDTVFLCPELRSLPDEQVRFIVAHEFAHAVMFEADIASVDEESAADELATIVLGDADDLAAVNGGAEFFLALFQRGHKEDAAHHPDLDRARAILMLEDGYDYPDSMGAVYLARARAAWIRLFLSVLPVTRG